MVRQSLSTLKVFLEEYREFREMNRIKLQSNTSGRPTILIICEGKSDKVLLNLRLIKLYPEIQFEFCVLQGDIFSKGNKDDIEYKIEKVMNQFCAKQEINHEDVIAVFQIVDTDGCFIDTKSIVVDDFIGESSIYTDNKIYTNNCKNRTSFIERNLLKQKNIVRMLAIKTIRDKIPYKLLYFSRNVEHTLFGASDSKVSNKVMRIKKLSASGTTPLETQLENYMPPVSKKNIKARYKCSWDFIMSKNRSLMRYSNVSLMFDFIDIYHSGFKQRDEQVAVEAQQHTKIEKIDQTVFANDSSENYEMKRSTSSLTVVLRDSFMNTDFLNSIEKPIACIFVSKSEKGNTVQIINSTSKFIEEMSSRYYERKTVWTSAIVICSTSSYFNKRVRGYICNRIYGFLKSSSNNSVHPSKLSTKAVIMENEQTEVEQFLDNTKLLLIKMKNSIVDQEYCYRRIDVPIQESTLKDSMEAENPSISDGESKLTEKPTFDVAYIRSDMDGSASLKKCERHIAIFDEVTYYKINFYSVKIAGDIALYDIKSSRIISKTNLIKHE